MRRMYGRGIYHVRPGFMRKQGLSGRLEGTRYCPDRGDDVLISECLQCPKYRVWEQGDLERCGYEHDELKNSGLYAKDDDELLEYLKDLDPETWRRLSEEKRNRERILQEMEAEKARQEVRPDVYSEAYSEEQEGETFQSEKNGEGASPEQEKDNDEPDDEDEFLDEENEEDEE